MAEGREATKDEVLAHIAAGRARGVATFIFMISGEVGYIMSEVAVRAPHAWKPDIDEAIRATNYGGRRVPARRR